jgi:hypothetical protein
VTFLGCGSERTKNLRHRSTRNVIDVERDESRRATSDADVRSRRLPPPRFNRRAVSRRVVLTVRRQWALRARRQRQDREAAIGVSERGADHAARLTIQTSSPSSNVKARSDSIAASSAACHRE